ncbi:uncharacterized protein J4E84_005523 [Alternaria hordeiaustralica]|uniref:uncharacterized protein n=1 Tax=Alternaria hordeiaustralica TaxID=1187925 RepID=UPI0020C24BC5|nr:uncharacterized protein J4E84_005523 [Alternaria hordeiaustralica]KAI4687152.1 hypothetical protein J4E84_005523 [Alternaria hordeiaustralica]
MDEDSDTPEDMAIMDHTDIDVFMSDYRSPPVGRSLEDLPTELIGMIAENLDKKSLSILQALGSRTILQAIDHALQLEEFSVVGFGLKWQTWLLGTPKSLFEAISPALRGLTSLNLELDMATLKTDAYMLALVKLINTNANLQALALSVGDQGIGKYQIRNESWAPLLQLLGGSPPFRLHSLHINGLVTSTTAPTLASIINAHSSTIRRIVLKNTNFHYPNTLRAFFRACANSAVSYYETENFYLHERTMIVGRYLADDVLEYDNAELHEDVNNNHCDSDASCHDWVKVNWDSFDEEDKWKLVFENEQGQKRRSYMYDTFMDVVEMVKEGSLRDS